MKIKNGSELRVQLCERELEQSKDLMEAINRSLVIQAGCRKNGVSETCAGRRQVILRVASMKAGTKAKKCP